MIKVSNTLRISFISLLMFVFVSCGGGDNAPSNEPPIAKAGKDIAVTQGQTFTLDASKSSDKDGNIVKYEWFNGDIYLGTGTTFSTDSFASGVYIITLKVTDNNGAEGVDSVKITVNSKEDTLNNLKNNIAPKANAGEDISIRQDKTIILDASKSSDEDGYIVKYEWFNRDIYLGAGKKFTIQSWLPGTYTITLKVTDNKGAKGFDTVQVTVSSTLVIPHNPIKPTPSNNPPVAKAEVNKATFFYGNPVDLNGSKSYDRDGSIVKYEWFENNLLFGIGKVITKNDFDIGPHVITLRVTDDKQAIGTHSVNVIVLPNVGPLIATISPNDQNQSVNIDNNITISFTNELNTSTLKAENIVLRKGTEDVNYTSSQQGNTLSLNPTSGFEYSTIYTLLLKDIADIYGNKIDPNPTISSFRTIAQP